MSGAIVAAGIGAAGAVTSGMIESNAAGNAAQQQASAANHAADLNYQASQNALNFQQQQYNNSQQEIAPWLQSGSQALTNLNYLLGNGQPPSAQPQSNLITQSAPGMTPVAGSPSGTPALGAPATGNLPTPSGINPPPNLASTPNTSLGGFGSLLSSYPGGAFQAPTAEQAAQAPGYQFQLQQGNQALQQSAAARGNLLTGGTAEALDAFNQGLAQNDYNNVYNQALQTYGTNYNAFQNQQANQFNRLASLAGVGQTAANTLGSLGQSAANGVSSNLLNTASQMGQDYQNAGAANASGIVGGANAIGGAIGGATGNLSQMLLLQSILGGGGGGGGGNLFGAVQNGNSQVMGTDNPIFGGYLG